MTTQRQNALREFQPVILMVPPDDSGPGSNSLPRETIGRMQNMGIMYLGAALEASGYTTITRDYQLSSRSPLQIVGEIVGQKPILIGFTMFESNVQSIRLLVSLLRLAYSGPIVVGGYTATFHATDILAQMPAVDFVVLREGEDAIVMLMEYITGTRPLESVPNLVYRDAGAFRVTSSAPLSDVTKLPWARRDWGEPQDVTPMISRRGCYGRCHFCSMVPFYDSTLGPIVRRRTPEDVVNEIEHCINHGCSEFMFYDDDFGLSTHTDQKWCAQFAQEIVRRKLRFYWGIELRITDVIRGATMLRDLCDLGLTHIAIGMESMLPRQIALYNKGYRQRDVFIAVDIAKSLPVDYQTNVIFWDPWLTLEEAEEHVALLDNICIQDQLVGVSYSPFSGRLSPRRGTVLHTKVEAAGLLTSFPDNFSKFGIEFADPRTAAFYHGPYLRLFARSRKIPRPYALWLLVMKLEHEGQHSRAEILRKCGSALAHTEFDFFRTILTTLKDIQDPQEAEREEQTIHEHFGPRIDSCARLLIADNLLNERHTSDTKTKAICSTGVPRVVAQAPENALSPFPSRVPEASC